MVAKKSEFPENALYNIYYRTSRFEFIFSKNGEFWVMYFINIIYINKKYKRNLPNFGGGKELVYF